MFTRFHRSAHRLNDKVYVVCPDGSVEFGSLTKQADLDKSQFIQCVTIFVESAVRRPLHHGLFSAEPRHAHKVRWAGQKERVTLPT